MPATIVAGIVAFRGCILVFAARGSRLAAREPRLSLFLTAFETIDELVEFGFVHVRFARNAV